MPDSSKFRAWLHRLFGKQPQDAIAPDAVALHRLLFLLLPALEARGFLLSPDRYIRLHRLFEAMPSDLPVSRWRHPLCAILASDAEQQSVFHLLFDQCLAAIGQQGSKQEADTGPAASMSAPPPAARREEAPKRGQETRPMLESRSAGRPLVVELDECIEPPFSWNIVPEKENVPVESGQGFGRTLMQLRRRETTDLLLPDLPASIRATIAEGGVPAFRYRSPTRPTEYLLLVERFALDDHRAALFDHFYHTLRQSEVIIDRFFYQGDLRLCRNERFSAGLTLQQMRYRFPEARLIVVGTGYRLLSAKTGEPYDWLRPLLGWRRRVLLTPVSRLQWGQRERALQSLFSLLPASLQSLHYLSDAPDEALHGDYESLPEYVRRIAETQPLAIEQPYLRSLRRHFDSGLLCWIAACAVYPALHYELTLRLGKLLSDSLGYNLLQAANLLALTRLPWFTEGRMPPEARTELMEWLEHRYPDQHRQVLDYLHTLMENNPPPEKSMAWAEHQINLALMELARNPSPEAQTLAQLRAVVKRLNRPKKRGDFVLPRQWEALLEKIGPSSEDPSFQGDNERLENNADELKVFVFENNTQMLLRGATVQLLENGIPAASITNKEGHEFSFPIDQAKTYQVLVSRPGFEPQTLSIEFDPPRNKISIAKEVFLRRFEIDLTTLVFDKVSEAPLKGVTVQLFDPERQIAIKTNNKDNKFEFPIDRRKEYTLVVSKPGFHPDKVKVILGRSSVPDLTNNIQKVYLLKKELADSVPLYLYFDHDHPDPGATRTTTDKTYGDTYPAYYGKKNIIIDEYSKVLGGNDRFLAEQLIEAFFRREVFEGNQSFQLFVVELLDYLKKGIIVQIMITGFAAPGEGARKYCLALGSRRVAAIRNEFSNFKDGVLLPYIKSGNLKLVEVSKGDQEVPIEVRKQLESQREAVFSPLASRQRRVQIIGVTLPNGG